MSRWDLKYRPRIFDDVVGHDVTVKILRRRVVTHTALDQSYVFSGPHGSGKTTLARILSNASLCEDPKDGNPCLVCETCADFAAERSFHYEERDAASKGGIDEVRQVVADLDYVSSKSKIICWDEAHRMSAASQDALLKPVEEHRLVCIFATTEAEKIRGAIRSRCDDFAIQPVQTEHIIGRLRYIVDQEGVSATDDGLRLIATVAGGHVRDAIKKMEMIARLGEIEPNLVKECLKLDVHTVAFQVLHAVADADVVKILDGLRSMMSRVTPSEAVSAISRAALQSYRLGFGLGDSVDPLDKEVALQLFKRLGANLPHLASYLADRPGRTSQESIECRVLSLTERLRSSVPLGPELVVVGGTASPTVATPPPKVTENPSPVSEVRGVYVAKHPPRGPLAQEVKEPAGEEVIQAPKAPPVELPQSVQKLAVKDRMRALLAD